MKIVLSPQRESFNHGCCVPGREATRENRSHSPIGKTETPHIGKKIIKTLKTLINYLFLERRWAFESDETHRQRTHNAGALGLSR